MKFRKRFIAIIIVFVILIFTNPTIIQFNNFSSEIPIKNHIINSKRVANGMIFSLYTKKDAFIFYDGGNTIIGHMETIKYLGIFSNFFKISRKVISDGRTQLGE